MKAVEKAGIAFWALLITLNAAMGASLIASRTAKAGQVHTIIAVGSLIFIGAVFTTIRHCARKQRDILS